jgi:hypothetical protein
MVRFPTITSSNVRLSASTVESGSVKRLRGALIVPVGRMDEKIARVHQPRFRTMMVVIERLVIWREAGSLVFVEVQCSCLISTGGI